MNCKSLKKERGKPWWTVFRVIWRGVSGFCSVLLTTVATVALARLGWGSTFLKRGKRWAMGEDIQGGFTTTRTTLTHGEFSQSNSVDCDSNEHLIISGIVIAKLKQLHTLADISPATLTLRSYIALLRTVGGILRLFHSVLFHLWAFDFLRLVVGIKFLQG